jgi:DNA-binding transcriptional ArsR family regulator
MTRPARNPRPRHEATYQPAIAAQVVAASRILSLLGHEQRFLALYHLTVRKEMRVNEMVAVMKIKQSAVSQHLAKLREEGLVTFRRDQQSLYYRIADARVPKLIALLQKTGRAKPRLKSKSYS